jgi:hypothetical protein
MGAKISKKHQFVLYALMEYLKKLNKRFKGQPLEAMRKQIKVKCIFDVAEDEPDGEHLKRILDERWTGFLKLKSHLKKLGLVFVSDNPDIILCSNNNANKIKKIPFIINERKDGSSLIDKKNLKNPNCLAVFKNHILRPKSLNNQPTIANRYHCKIISDFHESKDFELEREEAYTDEELKKIKCVIWDIFHSPISNKFKKLRSTEINFSMEREIDVLSCLSHSHTIDLIRWHRKKAIQSINDIKEIKSVTENIYGKDYYNALLNAKIIISPWGYGEYCYRDVEGMLAGAVIIKPDTSFVETIPDIYQNNITYVPCKPDFSDLKEKVYEILNNWNDYKEMRIKARKMLVDVGDEEEIAKQFVKNLKEVLKINE